MRIGSLFSGIGGLELGLEWAGVGDTVWQVEADDWCNEVLAKHWPNVDRYGDVRDVTGCHDITRDLDDDCRCPCTILAPVDVLCVGFPCQDVSDSQGAGLAGHRSGLWFEMLRLVRELRPRFVVVENVAALSTRGLDVVLGGLAASGYDAIWFPLRAASVGAPHGRGRVFVVAYANGDGFEPVAAPRIHVRGARRDHFDRCSAFPPGPRDGEGAWATYRSSGGPEPAICRGVDGFPSRLDRRRLAALGNAVVPQVAEVVGRVVIELAKGTM